MAHRMYDLKGKLLDYIEKSTDDLDRVNVKELGEFIDMVKDLAEAINYCSEADYFKSITKAMHDEETHGSKSHIKDDLDEDEDDILLKLGKEYHSLSHDERRIMRNKVLSTIGIR